MSSKLYYVPDHWFPIMIPVKSIDEENNILYPDHENTHVTIKIGYPEYNRLGIKNYNVRKHIFTELVEN